MSEMLHTEVGMAVAMDRPVLAFVRKGTEVGNFLPQAVQYITLNPTDNSDLQTQWPLISNYCRSALSIIQARWLQDDRNGLLKVGIGVLAGIGVKSIWDWLSSEDYDDEDDD